MESLAKKIADAIGRYHTGFMQKKVLKTVEEIEATSEPLEKYVAGAGSVGELSNKLESFQNGVDALYDKCVSCGATPSAKTPTAIIAAMTKI